MPLFDRRRLLQNALVTSAAAVWAGRSRAAAAVERGLGLIDSNVSLFHWPYRRLPLDEPAALAEKLAALGVVEAWAGSFEGLLHRDVSAVNARLAVACREHGGGLFQAFGTIRLDLPGWREDLRRCVETHGMPGLRLHPNHHGYDLAHPELPELLARAADAGLIVQIAASTEDTRTQPAHAQVPNVDLRPLPALVAAQPRARVQVLNLPPNAPLPPPLVEATAVRFDLARTEGTAGVKRLVDKVGAERVLFGSHAPFFIPEAALGRVEEALLAGLDRAAAEALLAENARRWRATA